MRLFLRAAACATGLLWAGVAAAEDSATFYKGKALTIVAGSASGGGVDVYARLLARHLPKHMPGAPSVIVQNMPGAGSLAAARHVYALAPKDGTAIGVVLSTALFDPLMSGQDLAAYDPRKFNFLGNANSDTSVCIVRRDSPVKTYADLFDTELVVGGTGPGSALVDYPVMEKHILGVKLKLISGYKGSNEVSLAIQRNEVQGVCGLLWSSAKQQYPEAMKPDGATRVLVQQDVQSLPALKAAGVPLVMDYARSEQQRAAMRVFLAQGSISRPFFAPPGAPAERVAALRAAFDATFRDADLQAEAARQLIDVMPQSGDEVQKMVETLYATPPDLIALLRKGTSAAQ